VNGELAGDAEGPGVELLDQALLLVELVADLADQLLEEVLEADEPRGTSVFVHHDGEVELLGLELPQQGVGPLGPRHEIGRVKLGAEVEVLRQPAEVGQEILGVEDPDDLIDGVLEHGHARVQVLAEQSQDLVGRGAHVEAEHVGARHHHLAHDGVLELEHLVDHLALGAVDHALARADVHQRAQLLLADLGLARRPLRARDPQGQGGEPAERPANRRNDRREPCHRPAHPRREDSRVLDRDGHGEHFPEDAEQKRHAPDGDGEPGASEKLARDGRGKRGGGDVHHGDSHEERDEQLVRLLEKRSQGIVLRPLLLGQLLEAGSAEGEVGRFGARQEGGAEQEGAEGEQLEDDAAIHGSARSPPGSGQAPPRLPPT
jgi:hypothetical protein